MSAKPTVAKDSQDWANIDGVTAWHLIERHADNWADIAMMMDEFIAAKIAKAAPVAPQGVAEVMQLAAMYAVAMASGAHFSEVQIHYTTLARAVTALVQERGQLREIRELCIKALCAATGASRDAIEDAPLTTALLVKKDRDVLREDFANCKAALFKMTEIACKEAENNVTLKAREAELERDAARYRLLRRGQEWSVVDGLGETLRAEALDSSIDAAIASTKEPK